MFVMNREVGESFVIGRRIEITLAAVTDQFVNLDVATLGERLSTQVMLPLREWVPISDDLLAMLVSVKGNKSRIGLHCDGDVAIERGEFCT